MKTSLRRYYPDQVKGLKPHASSQPADSPAPLVVHTMFKFANPITKINYNIRDFNRFVKRDELWL